MGRAKSSANRSKDASSSAPPAAASSSLFDDHAKLPRRSFMEHVHPYTLLPVKRTHSHLHHHNSHHPLSLKLSNATSVWLAAAASSPSSSSFPAPTSSTHLPPTSAAPHPLKSSPSKRPRTAAPPDPTCQIGSMLLNPDPGRLEPYPHPAASAGSLSALLGSNTRTSGTQRHTGSSASSSTSASSLNIPNLLYVPLRTLDSSALFTSPNLKRTHVRIHIPVDALTVRNPAVVRANLWGYRSYTEDSDIVAILIHSGFIAPLVKPPDTYQYLSVLVEIQKFQKAHFVKNATNFQRRSVNGITSRYWPASHYEGKSVIRVVSLAQVQNDDSAIVPSSHARRREIRLRAPRLIPWDVARKQATAASITSNGNATGNATVNGTGGNGSGHSGGSGGGSGSGSNVTNVTSKHVAVGSSNNKHSASQQVSVGHHGNGGSNNHKVLAKQSCLSGGLMAFDMINEPCLLYDLKEVGHLYTCDSMLFRLRREVLYVENDRDRWEIALTDADGDGTHIRFGKVNEQVMRDLRMASMLDEEEEAEELEALKLTVPLSSKKVDVVAKRMLWTDLVWDLNGVVVNGRPIRLTKMSFRQRSA